MGAVERSNEAVESYLSVLDSSHDSVTINQTTVTVTSEEYERERERALSGSVDVYVKVRNERGEVLHLADGDEPELPSTTGAVEPFERAARELLERQVGIACRIDGVEQATIFGIRDEAREHETLYRLAIVFEATPQDEAAVRDTDSENAGAEVVWRPEESWASLRVPQ